MADGVEESRFHLFAFGGSYALFSDFFVRDDQFFVHSFQALYHDALVNTPTDDG